MNHLGLCPFNDAFCQQKTKISTKRSLTMLMDAPAAKRDKIPPCKTCGGTDHQRKSNKKCKFYKHNEEEAVNEMTLIANEGVGVANLENDK